MAGLRGHRTNGAHLKTVHLSSSMWGFPPTEHSFYILKKESGPASGWQSREAFVVFVTCSPSGRVQLFGSKQETESRLVFKRCVSRWDFRPLSQAGAWLPSLRLLPLGWSCSCWCGEIDGPWPITSPGPRLLLNRKGTSG